MEILRGWILTIAVCAVIIEIIDILMPEGNTRKTAFIVCGIVLSISLIIPVTSIYDNLRAMDFDYRESRESLAQSLDKYTEEQIAEVTKEFNIRLTEHIENLVLNVDDIESSTVQVIIEEDHNSEDFGKIHRIYVNARAGLEDITDSSGDIRERRGSGFGTFGQIEEIRISIGGINILGRDDEPQDSDDETHEDERVTEIINIISDEFELAHNNIHVTIEDKG